MKTPSRLSATHLHRATWLLLFYLSQLTPLLAQEGIFFVNTDQALSNAQKKSLLPEKVDLFAQDSPLELTLESDFKQLNRHKQKAKYQAAMLQVNINDSIAIRRKIRIKPRGEFRRAYCSFPPLKLNFKRTKFEFESIQQLDKMKMVVDCRQSASYQDYLLREYLTYKLFNLFTDISFKVRLVHVRYLDTGREKHNDKTEYAFLIEDVEDVAERNGAIEIKQKKLGQSSTQAHQMLLVAMFNYMIGNTDWSVPGSHNVKLIRKMDIQEIYPYTVPYDFDYAGLVNTSYAVPYEKLGLNNVRQRMYLGLCYEPSDFQEVINLFMEKEAEVNQTIETFEYLDKRSREDIKDFLGEFYEQIKRKNGIRYFTQNCKR